MFSQLLSRIRRNHGLEHATIHMLSKRHSGFSAQGNSNHRGFYLNIFGNISEDAVRAAVQEAFDRLKNGESELAVHPNCGTVLLTTATMTTLAAQAAFAAEGMRQKRTNLDPMLLASALPNAILAAVVALIISRPVGLYLQRTYTTEGDLGDMEIVRVSQIRPTLVTRIFQVLLAQPNRNTANSYFIETMG
ncbi:MAG: DUF6391 domain-containing protein [Anaerolineae bacterium]|nr:DUF6391 domain-containing protein [Anaerolineae bacterium]